MLTPILALLLSLSDPVVPPVRATIVVTAERGDDELSDVPAAVTVLTRDEMTIAPVRSLSEIAAMTPGVVVFSADGSAGPPVVLTRGFFGGGEVDYLKVLVGDAPLRNAESGLIDWTRVRVEDVEKVEILRGPASAVWGDGSVGGVLRIVPREDAGVVASIEGGTGGFGAASARYGAPLGAGVLGAFASIERSSGSREHAAVEQTLGGLRWRGGARNAITATLQMGATERDHPGALPLGEALVTPRASSSFFSGDRSEANFTSAAVSAVLERVPLHLTASGERRSEALVRTILLAPGLPDSKRRELDTTSLSMAAVGEWIAGSGPHGAHRIRAGADGGRDAVDSRWGPLDQSVEGELRENDRAIAAAFVTDYWSISEPLALVLGLRWDRVSDSLSHGGRRRVETALSPRVGFSWQPLEPLTVYGQAARSFKAPTLDQMFDARPFPDFAGGSFTISNPGLVPQRADSVEVGARGSNRIAWQVSAYRMDVDDEIDFDVSTFRYANIGSTRHTGLELSASLPVNAAVRTGMSWAWSRVEPKIGSHSGRQLKNVPEHVARVDADVALPWNLHASAAYSLLGRRYLDDANQIPLGEAHVLAVRLSRALGAWSVYVDVLNLTGAEYVEFGYTLTGFDGIDMPYGYPAAGRRVRAGITRRF